MRKKQTRGKRQRPKSNGEGKSFTKNVPNEQSYVKDTETNNTFGGNSIEWFSRYPNLLMAAGSIPYPYKPGMRVPLGTNKAFATDTDPSPFYYVIPGILSIAWLPSVGTSNSQTSPVSIVGKEVYAKVREKFSGSIDADAPDFVIYFMALDSIFSYIAALKRVYRTLNAYSPENLFTPDGILHALGFSETNIADLRAHKMELFQRINELILMTRKFKCPRIMDIFNRHVWLNDHVYTDAPTIKSQFYVFAQHHFYKYELVDIPNSSPTAQAGGLQLYATAPWSVSSDVVGYLYNFGRSLIDALAASDDGYLISGYLMRAYEGYPEFTVDELLLGEMLVPKYNEEVLGEIENSHSLPYGYSLISNVVAQDPSTNAIISNPTVTYPIAAGAVKMAYDGIIPRFNARSDVPTIAESVINSRMMTYLGTFSTTSADATAPILGCTEIVRNYELTTHYMLNGSLRWVTTYFGSEHFVDLAHNVVKDEIDTMLAITQLVQWDWMPIIWLQVVGTDFSKSAVIGDTHNVTTIPKEALQNINTVCLYSLFNAFSVE